MAKTKNWFLTKFSELRGDFDFRLEKLILDVTEKISKGMIRKKYSRVKLAQKLDISAPAVTKILDGNSNFTLKSLLSLADALDADLKIEFQEKGIVAQKPVMVISNQGLSSAAYSSVSDEIPKYIDSGNIKKINQLGVDFPKLENAA